MNRIHILGCIAILFLLFSCGKDGDNSPTASTPEPTPANVEIVGNPIPSGGLVGSDFFAIYDGEVKNTGETEAIDVYVKFSTPLNNGTTFSDTVLTKPSTIAPADTASFHKIIANLPSFPSGLTTYKIFWK